MHAIPGQHDLPNHNLGEMHRSAFGTLVAAGRVQLVTPTSPVFLNNGGTVRGFAWEVPIQEIPENMNRYQVALIHSYIWNEGHTYPGADPKQSVKGFADRLKGYSLAVFGDNHKGFEDSVAGCFVFNCGGFMRRKSDEINYKPRVGILLADGSIVSKELKTQDDKFIQPENQIKGLDDEVAAKMRSFIEELSEVADNAINYSEAVKRYIRDKKPPKSVRRLLIASLEQK